MNLKKKLMKPSLMLMCGLARSGKSTWIRKNFKNDVVVCPDRIRKLIFGHQFHKDAEDFVWAFAKGMTKLILEQGKNVIIDATNLNSFTRHEWYKIAKDYDAKITVIWVKTSLKECKRRNAKSPEGEKLPENVLDGMASIFENPVEDLILRGKNIIEIPYKGKYGKGNNIYRNEIMRLRRNYGKQN